MFKKYIINVYNIVSPLTTGLSLALVILKLSPCLLLGSTLQSLILRLLDSFVCRPTLNTSPASIQLLQPQSRAAPHLSLYQP